MAYYYSRKPNILVKCENCGKPMEVKIADRDRGWGRFCSKSCKALEQEGRTNQFSDLLQSREKEVNTDHLEEGDPV